MKPVDFFSFFIDRSISEKRLSETFFFFLYSFFPSLSLFLSPFSLSFLFPLSPSQGRSKRGRRQGRRVRRTYLKEKEECMNSVFLSKSSYASQPANQPNNQGNQEATIWLWKWQLAATNERERERERERE